MSIKSRYRAVRRKSVTKIEPAGYQKTANAVYRGILRDRAKRRYSKPHLMQSLGKILTFDWDLFITDISAKPMEKHQLRHGCDYLILRGNYAGRIARFVGKKEVKKYGSFLSVRGNEIRVNCSDPGFAATPKLGCWMESIESRTIIQDRPPILLIQAKSIVGDIPDYQIHFAIRERNDLVAQWTYRHDITAETIDLPRIEETICKLGSHKRAHPVLAKLVRRGFYVCYEDDGWLVKCEPTQRLRFMRRSHMYSITICRSGFQVVNAMMNDYTLRSILPCRMFAGLAGVKQKQRAGHLRRSSSIMGSMDDLDFSDLLDDYDKTSCYKRIFNREGAVDGKCLCLDTPFLDAIRSYIEHGGLARDCITPNIVKWRRMIKYAAAGDDPYLLMSEVRIVNGQWPDAMDALPNSHFKKYSFSVVFYDGSVKQDSPKIAHKVIKDIKPKDDILETFKKRLYMNGAYLCIALSRRNVNDESLPRLFDNVQEFVQRAADKYGYVARKTAMGVHVNKQIYVDFQMFIKSYAKPPRGKGDDDSKYDETDPEEDLSDLSDQEEEEDESDLNNQDESVEYDENDYYDDVNDGGFYANTYK
eukprot:373911_1